MISAPLRSRASTTTVASASPATIRLRAGNRHGAGSTPGAYSETIRPCAAISRCERRVGARVVAVDAAAEHGDRLARFERTAMRGRIDPAREAGDDDDARRASSRASACATSEPYAEQARAPTIATVGRSARSQRPTARTKSPGGGSWIDRSRAGNSRVAAAEPRVAAVGEPSPVRAPRRTTREALEPAAARRVEQMLARLCGEHRDGEAAHSASSRGGAVRERLGEVLGLDSSACASAAIVAATARRARGRAPTAAGARPRASAAPAVRRRAPGPAARSRRRARRRPAAGPASDASPGGPASSTAAARGTVSARSNRSSSARDSFSR